MLVKKGNTYFVRYTVPMALREPLNMKRPSGKKSDDGTPIIVGKRSPQIWRTTRSQDKSEAKKKQHEVTAKIIRELEDEVEAVNAESPIIDPRTVLRRSLNRIKKLDTEEAVDEFSRIMDKYLAAKGIEDGRGISERDLRLYRSGIAAIRSEGKDRLFESAINSYIKTREGNINMATLRRIEKVLKRFSEWYGEGGVDGITRRVAGEYIAEVIVPDDTSFKTKVWHVSAIRSAWRYFLSRDWTGSVESNPWDGHLENYRGSRRGTSDTNERRTYTDEEIKQVLSLIDQNDPMFQVWIICLHHGCRAEEIASLRVSSVNLSDKSFEIVEGKNKSSVRTLPMHKDTVPLFESLAEGKKPESLLFGNIKADSKGNYSGLISKRGGRWLRSHISEDKSLVFYHSLRHTLTTALETAGVEPHLIKRIGGWSFQDETFGTYSKGPGLERMREALNSVDFDNK